MTGQPWENLGKAISMTGLPLSGRRTCYAPIKLQGLGGNPDRGISVPDPSKGGESMGLLVEFDLVDERTVPVMNAGLTVGIHAEHAGDLPIDGVIEGEISIELKARALDDSATYILLQCSLGFGLRLVKCQVVPAGRVPAAHVAVLLVPHHIRAVFRADRTAVGIHQQFHGAAAGLFLNHHAVEVVLEFHHLSQFQVWVVGQIIFEVGLGLIDGQAGAGSGSAVGVDVGAAAVGAVRIGAAVSAHHAAVPSTAHHPAVTSSAHHAAVGRSVVCGAAVGCSLGVVPVEPPAKHTRAAPAAHHAAPAGVCPARPEPVGGKYAGYDQPGNHDCNT